MSRAPMQLKLTLTAGILFIAAGASTALTAQIQPQGAAACSITTPDTLTLTLSSCHKRPALPPSPFKGILQLSAQQLKTLLSALNPTPATNS